MSWMQLQLLHFARSCEARLRWYGSIGGLQPYNLLYVKMVRVGPKIVISLVHDNNSSSNNRTS
jgi:hypothetical protein